MNEGGRELRTWAWLELSMGVGLATAVAVFAVRVQSVGLAFVAAGLVALGITWFLQPIPLNEPFGYMERNRIRLKPQVALLMVIGWLLIIGGGVGRWCCDL